MLRKPRARARPRPLEPGEWSGARPFVGREDVLGALQAALDAVRSGRGRFVLLHGRDGSGRAALGRRFVALAGKRRRGMRTAIADAADPANPAFRQLARQLTSTRRVGAALRRSAKEWIGVVVPVVGDIVTAIVETVQTLRKTQDSPSAPVGTDSTIDQVRLLLTFGGNDTRIIVLENLEASDPDELAGAFALIQRLPQTRTLFIGTSVSTGGKLPGQVRDLVHEAERLGVGQLIEIPRLTSEVAAHAAELAAGTPLPTAWRAWLDASAPATPTELWDILGELERDGLLVRDRKLWRWGPHPPAPRLPDVAARVPDVAPEEHQLLSVAALCGPTFRVSQLTRALEWTELRTEDLLAPLLRRRLVSLRETLEEEGDLVDVYAFESPADAAAWAARASSELRESVQRRLAILE